MSPPTATTRRAPGRARRAGRGGPGGHPHGRARRAAPVRRGRAGPHGRGAGRHRDRARERGPHGRARRPARPRRGGALPGLGDAAARAALAALRHGRPAPRRAAPPRPRRSRAAAGRGRAGALAAPAAGQGSRRPRTRGRLHRRRVTVSSRWCADLAAAAYVRVDLVERRGEFAVRGGIVDVFPPTEEHPLRLEFWGDAVEEIRRFAVADQRSLDAVDALWAPPCRELLLTDEVRAEAAELAREHPSLRDLFAKLAEGHAVEGMESLAPVLVGEMETLADLLPASASVLLCDPERIKARAADLVATSEEFLQASWAAAATGGEAPIDLGPAAFHSLDDAHDHVRELGHAWLGLSPFGLDEEATEAQRRGHARRTAATRSPRSPTSAAGWPTTSGSSSSCPATARPSARWSGWPSTTSPRGSHRRIPAGVPGRGRQTRSVVEVLCGELGHGLVLPASDLVILTHDDLVGQRAAERSERASMPSRRRKQVDPLELTAGDLVVHEQHGVGRYVELVNRTVHGAAREYLVIEYAPSKRGQPGDRLFVPMDQLDQVSRYVGGESPSLDKLGGSDWGARKSRARRAVRQIAAELIKLYAARQATQGHAFGPDTPWQAELEDAFAFVETPDQLSTVDEVKRDMERTVPMDRLVCGDVGYGKTEIAVRAAFKAIQDGKQVILLVPTTLLVQQHFATFAERFGQFPVTIRPLSRFQSDREAKETLAGLEDGTRRPRHRHPSPAAARHPHQGPRPRDRRRGAALRRRAQGGAQAPPRGGRRAEHVRDPDPAHARDGDHRHPRDVHDRDAAGGAAPGAELRRRVRREADHRRHPARAAARGPGVLHPQPGAEHRQGGAAAAGAGARGADRRRARPDGRAQARAGDGRLLGEALRRAGVHDDRRVRPRRLQREHDDHRARRHARAVPAAPAARTRRPRSRAGLRVLPVSRPTSRSPRPRTTGWPRSRSTPSWAAACRWP